MTERVRNYPGLNALAPDKRQALPKSTTDVCMAQVMSKDKRKGLFRIPFPADTQRKNDVIMTSKRRCDVVLTLLLRRVPTGYAHVMILCLYTINTVTPGYTIWRHRYGLKPAQEITFCLATPSYYLNLCWLIISNLGPPTFNSGHFHKIPQPSITKISLKITHLTVIRISQGPMS